MIWVCLQLWQQVVQVTLLKAGVMARQHPEICFNLSLACETQLIGDLPKLFLDFYFVLLILLPIPCE